MKEVIGWVIVLPDSSKLWIKNAHPSKQAKQLMAKISRELDAAPNMMSVALIEMLKDLKEEVGEDNYEEER